MQKMRHIWERSIVQCKDKGPCEPKGPKMTVIYFAFKAK